MNAAAALVVGNKAEDLKEGVALAAAAIDERSAAGKLEDLIALSRRLGSPRRTQG